MTSLVPWGSSSPEDVEFQILWDTVPGSDFERAGAAILRPEAFVRDRSILGTLGAAISRAVLYGSLTLPSVRFAQAAAILDSGCGAANPSAETPWVASPFLRAPPPGSCLCARGNPPYSVCVVLTAVLASP